MATCSTLVTTGIVLSNPATQNSTTITATGTVTNTNPADAVYGTNAAAWTLSNYGTINATANYSNGINFLAGGLVSNAAGAFIAGPDGVQIGGAVGTVLNAGTIIGTEDYGVRLDTGGTVSNVASIGGNAQIIGGATGILLLNAGGSVYNGAAGSAAATISGTYYGVSSRDAAATVTNHGTIVGTSAGGIFLQNGGVVTNASGGVVASSNRAINIVNAVGSVDNAGTIEAGITAAAVYLAAGGAVTNREGGTIAGGGGVQITGQGTLANLGTITGGATSGFGVVFAQGGSLENGSNAVADAVIVGTLRGVQIYGTPGATGTVSNFGTIAASVGYAAALYLQAGGSVTNQSGGLIEGGGVGIAVGTSTGTVSNFGTVTGSGAHGILFAGGGSIANSGLIFGGNYGINLFGGAGTVANSGTIASDGFGVRLSATTLTNSGTIVGGSGIAVYFTGTSSNRLIVDPGAVFSGNAGGNTADDTLELAAGAGTIAGLGSSFSGFEQIAVDASGSWLLTGYNVLGLGTTLSDAGTLTSTGTLLNNGVIGIAIGAEFVLDGSFGGGGTIDFPGLGGGTLEIGGTTMPSNTITGVEPGDTFQLADIPFDSSGTAKLLPGNVLRISENGSTFNLQLDPSQDFTGFFFHLAGDGGGGTLVTEDTTPCFCRGTLIRTPSGEVPVEELGIGDWLSTASGIPRPIKWIGRRAYDARFVGGNRNVLPIRIEAGALALGVPARDLCVSPEHALYLDGVLVPARLLVNGTTVRQPARTEPIEYFHIELDTHDVIFAEGAATETFVDCDNRFMFQNAGEFAALYPGEAPVPWDFCAPRAEAGSPELAAIRAALLARAERLGRVTCDPDLHLIVDGTLVRAQSIADQRARFTLPASVHEVTIASRSVVPIETEACSLDERRLGVPVERIILRGAGRYVEIGLDSGALYDGFHDDEGTHRWTDGCAALPAELFAGFADGFAIEVQIGASELRYPTDSPAPALPARRAASTERRRGGLRRRR